MGNINSDTVGALDLDDFVSMIPQIYAKKDEIRSIWDVWLHANHHASAIGEEVRKNQLGGALLNEIADFSMWLFTIAGKLKQPLGVKRDIDKRDEEPLIRISKGFSDLLWSKYPNICPVCYWRRTRGDRGKESTEEFRRKCDCLQFDVEFRKQDEKQQHVETLRAYAGENQAEKPTTVDNWQAMFGTVYEANLRHIDLTDIAFHLLEEMGEVSDAMVRMYSYVEERPFTYEELRWRQIWLEEEIADVSSWLFALVKKLDLIRVTADEYDKWHFTEAIPPRTPIQLSQIIWKRYGSDDLEAFFCQKCKKIECECKIHLVGKDDFDHLASTADPS